MITSFVSPRPGARLTMSQRGVAPSSPKAIMCSDTKEAPADVPATWRPSSALRARKRSAEGVPPIVVVDTWDGYAGEREQILDALDASVDNLVVLSGDFHSAAVGDLRSDPFDLTRPVIGAEFMASAISSAFFDDAEAVADLVSGALAANPQLRWFDGRRGYTICDVTPERWLATYRAVADPFDEASTVDTVSEWEITAGVPGARSLAE